MVINKNKFYSLLLIIFGGYLFLNIFNTNVFYLRTLLSSLVLILFPGYNILSIIKIKNISFWEYIILSIAISLAFLMCTGLIINWELFTVGISNPLSFQYLFPVISVLIGMAGCYAYYMGRYNEFTISQPRILSTNFVLYLLPLLTLLLSIFGAISLNNGGSNLFIMLMLFLIAVNLFLLIIVKKVNSNLFPYSLFFFSLCLLFMTSLRGWYITGHDIQKEYYTFRLTSSNSYWNISKFKDIYNACLSLTILPTIFLRFLAITDTYIYKVIYQILFASVSITLFFILKNFVSEKLSLLATFIFLSFPTYINDMPMLNRQEIGFIYFSLFIYLLVSKLLQSRQGKFLFYVFVGGMIVSHYSTTYVAVALIVGTFLCSYITTFVIKHLRKNNKLTNYFTNIDFNINVSLTMVICLCFMSFLWYSQITNTAQGVGAFIHTSFSSINKLFIEDRSNDTSYSLINTKSTSFSQLLTQYTKNIHDNYRSNNIVNSNFTPILIQDQILPLSNIGQFFKALHLDSFTINYLIRQLIAKILQVLIIIGIISLLFYKKFTVHISIEFVYLIFISMLLLLFSVIVPQASVGYGILRLFQQLLVILSLPALIGLISIIYILKGDKFLNIIICVCVIIPIYLSLSGWLSQMLGGYYPQLNLNNSGIYYDLYYTHKAEVFSAKWLASQDLTTTIIESDTNSGAKLLATEGLFTDTGDFPQLLYKNDYIFLNYVNVNRNITTISFDGNLITFQLPSTLANKNLVYNNGGSRIYK